MTTASARPAQRLSPSRAELVPTAIRGISIANEAFDSVVAGLRASLLRLAASQRPVELAVPPVVSRELLERVGYVDAFPHLLATMHSFTGSRERWRELQEARTTQGAAWHTDQSISDAAVLPATCYHVYPLFTGEHLPGPLTLTAEAYCYRHEATHEPGRLRSFRMREFVRLSTPDDCRTWRDEWTARSRQWLTSLGLQVSVEPASDPFFGDAARLMGASQREQELKWELRSDVGDGRVQAIASANYHKEHFGEPFGIEVAGGPAHTACAAFGMERITLALVAAHGAEPDGWPSDIRARLWPAS